MRNFVERRRAHRAHHLQRDAQDRAGGHGAVLVHPFFRARPLEIFGDADELVVLDAEIVEGGNVDVVDLLRGNRFLLELGSDGRLERSCREHFDIHIAAGIDLVATISACGGDLFRRRAHRNTRRLGGDLRDLVRSDPVFAEKNSVFHKLNLF